MQSSGLMALDVCRSRGGPLRLSCTCPHLHACNPTCAQAPRAVYRDPLHYVDSLGRCICLAPEYSQLPLSAHSDPCAAVSKRGTRTQEQVPRVPRATLSETPILRRVPRVTIGGRPTQHPTRVPARYCRVLVAVGSDIRVQFGEPSAVLRRKTECVVTVRLAPLQQRLLQLVAQADPRAGVVRTPLRPRPPMPIRPAARSWLRWSSGEGKGGLLLGRPGLPANLWVSFV